jgi:hypothetical protein
MPVCLYSPHVSPATLLTLSSSNRILEVLVIQFVCDPDGRVIFVTNEPEHSAGADADLFVRESQGPAAIPRALIAYLQSKAA